jgi:capsular polysaccharide biosynthesis protein
MRNKNKEVQFEQPSDILILINHYLLIIVAIIVVAILAVGYFFFLHPKVQDINSIKQEDTQTQEDKLQNEKLLNKIKELEHEFNSIKSDRQEDLDKLKLILPEEPQIAELFVLADSIASKHNFELTSIDISEDTSESATPSPATTEANVAPTIDGSQDIAIDPNAMPEVVENNLFTVKSLIVHLAISRAALVAEEGEDLDKDEAELDVYQDFKDYIDDLQKNLRLMDIVSISFGDLTQAKEGSETSFNLDIITYFRDNGQK